MLPLKDSNLNKQYQKLSYYRYTKGQWLFLLDLNQGPSD